MNNLPNPDQQWSNLSRSQRDGLSCVWCNSGALPMEPAGYSVTTSSQVFACVGSCAGHLQATSIIEDALGHTAPIDVQAARLRYELARLRHELGELLAELDAAIAAPEPASELVDELGARVASVRAGLDAIEATS